MRENHHDIQTTKRETAPVSSNRKAKQTINTTSKKLNHQQQKSIKRNLSSAFTRITEDDDALNLLEGSIQKISSISESVDVHQSTVEIGKTSLNSDHDLVSENADVLQLPEQSIGISSVSEAFVSNGDKFTECIESYIVSSKQLISPSSAATGFIEMIPSPSLSSSSPITVEDMNSFKIESLVKDLRESMCQVLNSADLEPKHQKLFDALVKMVIDELHSLHEQKDMMIVLLSFVLAAIVAGSVGFFMFSDSQSSYYGPPPPT
ncbi:hypothetical protein L1987_12402 [Smallanthus sonchifolius]|uniref:Uncharacterized protein n=1 Tax=Smallanthus sonchifolius TaxID=185202 RepID=A0ACB9JFS2_9ASTR|nr:hypothetical protein L1987_12402 [Smallanthus sonchifolius]